MKKVKSCGVLVFRSRPTLSFLLMKHANRYDIPKGHIESGESEGQCALRELYEETGFCADDVQIEDGFEFRHTYYPKYKRFGGKTVEKTLVVFVGRLLVDKHVSLTEHNGHEWVPWAPPHAIQPKTIDPLLAEVQEFGAERLCD
ncbi:MAG: NUDIX domain-containing protein [Phycisphaerae bacterium]|jgi:8-oxo-dGTP pyrophosphatase MutT (NUDIX family)|nr:NUDIX domain-containing protein [Phycisphaerae bacterium]MDP7289533.1 NUDIX domain-containing protein [Phycisphaerae bacterium]